jgi:serine/threonine protein kinase
MIIVPGSYDDDDSPQAYWWEDSNTKHLFKTCIAYETLGDNHPRLLHYLSRDPWTGLPMFTKPTGPSLEKFIEDNNLAMYPPELKQNFIQLSPEFQPLILNWALQLLSALKFIHSHKILYGTLGNQNCWLSSDLSLLLTGFMDAEFRDGYGYRGSSSVPNVSVRSDVYGWALFVYRLMTNNHHDWPEVRDFPMSGTRSVPRELPAGDVLRKCYTQQYEDVEQVLADFQAAIMEKGYGLDGNVLKGFALTGLLDRLIPKGD